MIKIEVTGTSIPEVADKLLAIGYSLRNAPGENEAAKPEPRKTKRVEKTETVVREEVAEEPVGEPSGTRAMEVTTDSTSAEQPTEASSDPSTADTPTTASPLDFEKDVAPVVLKAVKLKGKPWVQDILSQFGVERASQIDDARLGEFVALVQEGIA